MKPVCISITGTFETDDLAELTAALRRIDERHPDRLYAIVIRGGPEDTALDDAERVMHAMLPETPNRKTVITTVKHGMGKINGN